MGFLQPLALLGLAAAALPALLHLLQRREPPTVTFPPVRYLAETERRHSRRLRLRNLLLLLLRTAAIVFLVLAWARPVAPVPANETHAPSALAVIVDNSLSAAAVREGRAALETLAGETRAVLEAATEQDRLWLVLADGVPRRVSRMEGLRLLDGFTVQPVRLDLGEAVRAASRLVADDPLPGTVVVLSDLQASALSPGEPLSVRVVFRRPLPPPPNRWIDSAVPVPPTWTPAGAVMAAVGGGGDGPAELRLLWNGETLARDLAAAGDRVVLRATLPRPGWYAAQVVLAADELRLDDTRHVALRAAAPVAVSVRDGAGPFVEHAAGVLREAGRLVAGGEVTLDERPAAGRSVVFPPRDDAMIGAVNRQLAARGVRWRFGEPLDGEWQVASDVAGLDSAVVRRRMRLLGQGETLARVAGEPWLVRDGDVVLVASRMEERWTALPVSAGFVPYLDELVSRVAVGAGWRAAATPGAPVAAPAGARALVAGAVAVALDGSGRVAAPLDPGVYFLRGVAGDTIGALEVNHDPLESRLAPAREPELRATFGGELVMADGDRLPRHAFAGARRADLSTLLLVLAAAAVVAEFLLASLGGRRESAD